MNFVLACLIIICSFFAGAFCEMANNKEKEEDYNESHKYNIIMAWILIISIILSFILCIFF